MHDLPRQKLAELVAQYGHGLCDDPKRLEGMLKDVLRNEHKRELFVLVSALREGVAAEFRNSVNGMPLSAVAAKLVRQLRDNLAFDEMAARWGVESWALALGVTITKSAGPVTKLTLPPVMVPPPPPTVKPRKPKKKRGRRPIGPPLPTPEGQQESLSIGWVLGLLLIAVIAVIAVPYWLASFLGSWFPWTSTVVGVVLAIIGILGTLVATAAVFDQKSQEAGCAAFALLAVLVFGCLLFRAGRAEIRSNTEKTAQAKEINSQIELVNNALGQGRFEESLRLVDDLKTKVTPEDMPRIEAMRVRAESGTRLHQLRVVQANERVALLVTKAEAKLITSNAASEEAERILGDAFAVPLATNLEAARSLAKDLVRRRVFEAQSYFDMNRFDAAQSQLQAAQRIPGTPDLEEVSRLAAAISKQMATSPDKQ